MLKTGMIIAERYEILGKIGTGGMADVYKAKDHKLNRFVAVKVLKQEFREDTTFIRKFRSEAQAAAGLTHPNIVNVPLRNILPRKASFPLRRPPVSPSRFPWDWRPPITTALSTGM